MSTSKNQRVTVDQEAEYLSDQELIRIHHPDLGGEPAVATRQALRTLYADRGFKEVISPEGETDLKYATADTGAKRAEERLAGDIKGGNV